MEFLYNRFLIGDLNFGINLPEAQILKNVEDIEELLRQNNPEKANEKLMNFIGFDEFNTSKNYSDFLIKYQEPKPNFMPTAVYDPFSTIYQSNTTPSWSDRILVVVNEGCILKQFFYKRKEYVDSTL